MAIACDRVRDLAPGFVLGALDAAEMAAVREHLQSCTKPHPELRELGGVVSYLGSSLAPIEPRASLKTAVLAAVQADMLASSALRLAPVSVAPVLTVVESGHSGVISFAAARAIRVRRMGVWATRIAAAFAIVGLVGYAVNLQSDLNRQHQAQATANSFYDQYGVPGVRQAELIPAVGHKGAGHALLLPSGNVKVLLYSLEPTKGDEVYSVWLSSDGGAVVKAGWFTVDETGVGYLEMTNVGPSTSLWLMVCKEPNAQQAKPGPVVVTGTIDVYPAPPATPVV
jgi:hypothetical protein